jgi:hypothetical protein
VLVLSLMVAQEAYACMEVCCGCFGFLLLCLAMDRTKRPWPIPFHAQRIKDEDLEKIVEYIEDIEKQIPYGKNPEDFRKELLEIFRYQCNTFNKPGCADEALPRLQQKLSHHGPRNPLHME